MSEVGLSGADIRRYLEEVAAELPQGSGHTVIMVGGSLLAWHGLRASTHDVDTLLPVSESLHDAVARVGRRHGLDPAWLNDRARAFRPHTLREEDCDVLVDHPALRVLGAPLEQLFLMKLEAARSTDVADLAALWPRCAFASAQEAADLYYQAYPLARRDDHLTEFIEKITR